VKLPAYPKYKPSGVEWLGDVPEDWEIKKLRYLALLKSGENITSEQLEEEATFPVYGGNGLRGYSTRFTHDGDYVLIGRQGALCGNINYAKGKFWASEHAVVVQPLAKFATFWMGETLRAMNLNQYAVSAAQPGLAVDKVSALKIPVPPSNEQRAIADFLDRQTARLDTLVGKKRELIEKLKEKRTALISRTVTRGLPPAAARAAGVNPKPKLKPSGIEWLSEIPEHWDVVAYKRVCTRVDVGIAEAATHAYTDDGVPIIRSTNVKPNRLDTSDVLRIEPWFAEKNLSKTLHAGDLVTVRTGYPGTTAVIPPDFEGSQCFTLVISTPKRTAHGPFFSWVMNSDPGISYFETEGWGTAQTNISVPIVQFMPVPRPPVSEQRAISGYLDHETAKLDRMMEKVKAAIETLQEYRIALITAAVTGKIDVRRAVA
jgi:type I restriction enzyme S subunit